MGMSTRFGMVSLAAALVGATALSGAALAQAFRPRPGTLGRTLGPLINGERCAPPTLLGTLSLSNGRQRRSGIRRRQRAALQIPCSVRTFAKLA